jgi:hypothetical protein
LLDNEEDSARLIREEKLRHRVYRVLFEVNGVCRSLIVKSSRVERAERSRMTLRYWLPAVGLDHIGPVLLGATQQQNGAIWNVYVDHGRRTLIDDPSDSAAATAAIRTVAELHSRFMGHSLLAECRNSGQTLDPYVYESSVMAALSALESIEDLVGVTDAAILQESLTKRLRVLAQEVGLRTRLLKTLSGPQTLLHGDLYPSNIVLPNGLDGPLSRIVDWDHLGVGPVGFDLVFLLGNLSEELRLDALECYRSLMRNLFDRWPTEREWNTLFDTFQFVRLAKCVTSFANAILVGEVEYGVRKLRDADQWFQDVRPVLPVT